MSKPNETDGDSPPESPTSDEEEFQRDLQTAIQRSIEEAYAASTSGLNGSSYEDESEESPSDDDTERAVDNQPNVQEEKEDIKREDDQEEECNSEGSGGDTDSPTETGGDSPPESPTSDEEQFQRDLQTAVQRSIEEAYGNSTQPAASTSGLTGSSYEDESEENPSDDDTERAVDNQPNVQEEKEEVKKEDDQEEECNSEGSGGDTDSLTISSLSDDESEEHAVDVKPSDQAEAKAIEQEGDQGDGSSPVDSGEEHDSTKKTGTDRLPVSLTPEEVQYIKDLQIAIQRSIEEALRIRKHPAASTSALTGSSCEDEIEENSADDNTERAVDNQPNVQEEKEATKQEDEQDEEPSTEDSDRDMYSPTVSSLSDDESDEDGVDDKPNDQAEAEALEQKDDQEKNSSPGDSVKEQNATNTKGTDCSPGIPTPEEVQFQKDLQTAIQRSIEEACGNSMQPVPSTSGITNSRNQRSIQTWDRRGTLTASSSEDEGEEDGADEQPNRQEKPQTLKQENDQEEEYSSEDSDKEHESLNGSSSEDESEENAADDKTVNAVGSQTDVQEESQPRLQEGDEEEESSSEDTDKENDSPKEEEIDVAPRNLSPDEVQFQKDLQTAIQRSLEDACGTRKPPADTTSELTDSSSEDESEENPADDKTVNAVGTQTDIQEESQPLLEEDDEEEESSSGHTGKEHDSPNETAVDCPRDSLTPEEIQFRKDLQTAIQRSLEEACGTRKQPAATTRESKKSEFQHPPDTGHSSKTLTGSFTEDKSEERKADDNTVHDADNQPCVQEEAQALEGENVQQNESPSEDSGINSGACGVQHNTNSGRRCQRSKSPTGGVTSDTQKITPFPAHRDSPREIDPDAPRCPVGEGALKKMFRRSIQTTATASSSSDADAAHTPMRGVWTRSAQSVWQYPLAKRPAYTDQFPTEQQIVTDETRSVSKNAADIETSDSMQGLKAPEHHPAFSSNSRRRWSKPLPICADNIAPLQRQKTVSVETEKDKPDTRNIFQEIRRWELREYMEANKCPRALNIKGPAPTRDNSQPNVKNDNQQPPPVKESSERGNLRYIRQPPVTKDSNKVIVLKAPQFAGQQKKTSINTEEPKKITGNEECKKDAQDPQSSTRPVIVSVVLKKDEQAAPGNTKETSTVEEQNNKCTELLLRDIVRVYFEKKGPASPDRLDGSVQKKYEELQIVKGKRTPFYKKVKNCSGSKVSKLPIKVTGIQIKSAGKQSIPEDEIRIREMTKKLLEDIKEVGLNKTPKCNTQQGLEIKEIDLNEIPNCNTQQGLEIKEIHLSETPKCNTQEGLHKTHQEQPDGNVIKHEEQQISDAKTICDEKVQITLSDTDSAVFDNKFNKLRQICVDEKEMSEKQAEAAGKFSSDRCKKIRYIRRRTKNMDKRNFTAVSTVYRAESDATAKQENEVVVDEKQHYYTGTNIKSDIQSHQKAFSKEKHMEEMQASQYRYAHGKKLQQSGTAEKEMTEKKWKGKIFRKEVHSRQIPGTVSENISQSVSPNNIDITDYDNTKLGSKMNQNQLDFLRMVPTFYQNGCAEKVVRGSVDTVQPIGADVEDESYLDELSDSFDIIKQDISIIQEDIRRRAQRYGYMRGRRRRMASAHRSKRLHRSADKQCPGDKKDTTQPKTGYLRRLPSLSWKGPLQNNTLYDQIRKRWLSKPADGTTQMDKSSSSELQKFTRSVSGRFVRWCSCSANTNLHNDQHSPPPQIQGPPDEIQPGDMDKESQVLDKQPYVPVTNVIDNSEKSHSGPLQEVDNDVEDETDSLDNLEITQEQRNVMQAAIRNYLRTFGVPVHRVTSVSFVQDDYLEADKDSAKGEHVLGKEMSSDYDSSKQNKNSSSMDDDSDGETEKDPGDDVDQ